MFWRYAQSGLLLLQKYESESEDETNDTSLSATQPAVPFSPAEPPIKMETDRVAIKEEAATTNVTICHDADEKTTTSEDNAGAITSEEQPTSNALTADNPPQPTPH